MLAYSEEEIIKESSLIELVVLEEAIKKLEVEDNEYIGLNLNEIIQKDEYILEIVNINKSKVEKITVKGKLDYDEREELVKLIAALNKNKKVKVTFWLHYNYEMIKNLFELNEKDFINITLINEKILEDIMIIRKEDLKNKEENI